MVMVGKDCMNSVKLLMLEANLVESSITIKIICHQVALMIWEVYLTSLNLSLFICKKEVRIFTTLK